MPNLHVASRCAIFVFVLFSCNTKTNEKQVNENSPVVTTELIKASPEQTLDLTALHADFIEKATQHFSVTAKTISSVKSKGGLKIKVDPGSLEREDGTPLQGDIDISIIELTNANDLFKSNAATVSNGRLLISGGSYFIGMKNGNTKLRIKNGKSIETEFPFLKKDDMELFYGERDAEGSMNWKETGKQLKQEFETVSFNTYDNDIYGLNSFENIERPDLNITNKKHYMFPKIDSKVFFLNRMMTIQEMVKTMQRWGKDRIIDTVYYSWTNDLDIKNSIRYVREPRQLHYGFVKGRLYRIISSKESIAERDSFANIFCQYEEKQNIVNAKRAARLKEFGAQQPMNFTQQLKKTYAPAAVTELGWINCDKFYNPSQQTQTELELPYALNNTRIEYFLVFNSFSGLLNGRTEFTENKNVFLNSMPVGEKVTLVAFTKKDGILYQAKEDFVVARNKRLPLNFKEISKEEITKLFGSSVKI